MAEYESTFESSTQSTETFFFFFIKYYLNCVITLFYLGLFHSYTLILTRFRIFSLFDE